MPVHEQGAYTWGGPAEVERRIAQDQQRVAAAVLDQVDARQLAALVLAGGYGRGEGGWRWDQGVPVPFNDYDYFVVVRGLGRRRLRDLSRRLASLGHELSRELGLEVDFAVLAEKRLSRLPEGLMYSELRWRNRCLVGDASCLRRIRSPAPEDLPLGEFTRMMLNRGALLLMNELALKDGPVDALEDEERFDRYVAKAVIAAGEARLAAAGCYRPSIRSRQLSLASVCAPSDEGFLDLHRWAVHVKYGRRSGPESAEARHARQSRGVSAWLGALRKLEGRRLGAAIGDWQPYARADVDKGQSGRGPGAVLKHVALHVRDRRRTRWVLQSDRLLRNPRERLLAALPLLLSTDRSGGCPSAAAALGEPLHAEWRDLAQAFLASWRRYC